MKLAKKKFFTKDYFPFVAFTHQMYSCTLKVRKSDERKKNTVLVHYQKSLFILTF